MTPLQTANALIVQTSDDLAKDELTLALSHLAAAYSWLVFEWQSRQVQQTLSAAKPTVGTMDAYNRSTQ